MFSISVPVKSHVAHLAAALDSLRQQRAPLAVALLDASGDPAVDIIADASGFDFAWRRHAPDAGQAAAIAEGWEHAPGDILGWLNADDVLLPGTLATVGEIFAAEPEIDVIYGHGVMLDADGAFTGYFASISSEPVDLRTSNVICQPACFVRRAVVERAGGLDRSLHYAMDWDLWLRLFESGARFRFIDRPLAAVRTDTTTKTRTGGAARRREVLRLMAPRLSVAEKLRLRLGLLCSEARDNGYGLRLAVLETLFAMARCGRPPKAPAAIRGVDRATGNVALKCRITLPAFVDSEVGDLVVETDRPVTLMAQAGDRQIASLPATTEPEDGKFTCRIPGVPLVDRVVTVDLSAREGGWRLYRVAIDATSVPT